MLDHDLCVLIAFVENTLKYGVEVGRVLRVRVVRVLDYVDDLGKGLLIEHRVFEIGGWGGLVRFGFVKMVVGEWMEKVWAYAVTDYAAHLLG